MPYKDPSQQREAVRKSVAKLRSKQSITKKSVIPVKPKSLTPTGKNSNHTLGEILAKIEQLSEQQKIFYEQLSSGKVNTWPTVKKTPKGKKFIFYVYE